MLQLLLLLATAILTTFVNLFTISEFVLRMLPDVARLAYRLILAFLWASVFLYRTLLSRLTPFMQRLGVHLLAPGWRVLSCLVISLLLGCGGLVVLGQGIVLTVLFGSAAHGILVGIAWDDLRPPNGLTLGA